MPGQISYVDGIQFPATQVPSSGANVLDDYEENTYNPTVTPAAGAITTVSATGLYTKIGRQVNFHFSITITTNGTGSGTLNMTLPFTSGSNAGGVAREKAAVGMLVNIQVLSGGTYASLHKASNDGYPGGDGYEIVGSISYSV